MNTFYKYKFDTYYLRLNKNNTHDFIKFYLESSKSNEWETYEKIKIIPNVENYQDFKIMLTNKFKEKFIENKRSFELFFTSHFSSKENYLNSNQFFLMDLTNYNEEIRFDKFFIELHNLDEQFFLQKKELVIEKVSKYSKRIQKFTNESTDLIYFDQYISKDPLSHAAMLNNITRIFSSKLGAIEKILITNKENARVNGLDASRIYFSIKEMKENLQSTENEFEKSKINSQISIRQKELDDLYSESEKLIREEFKDYEILKSPCFHDRYIVFSHFVIHFYGGSGDIQETFNNRKSTGVRIYFPFQKNQIDYLNYQMRFLQSNSKI